MKNNRILNSQLIRVIAEMGHTDSLAIVDAGFPVPLGVERVDLALVAGVPTFLEVLTAVMSEFCVEESVIAAETKKHNPELYAILTAADLASAERHPGFVPPPNLREAPSHVEFKRLSLTARAIVRSGETVPYANIILYSGVTF